MGAGMVRCMDEINDSMGGKKSMNGMHEWLDEWMDEWVGTTNQNDSNGCMHGWMESGWMDESVG